MVVVVVEWMGVHGHTWGLYSSLVCICPCLRSGGRVMRQGSVFSILWGNFSSVSVLIVDWMRSSSIDATLYFKQEIVYFKNLLGAT